MRLISSVVRNFRALPWGSHTVKSLQGATIFRHSDAPFDRECLVSMAETAVQGKGVAFVHAMADAAPLRPILSFAAATGLVCVVAIALREFAGIDFMMPVLSAAAGMFFVRLVMWYWLRESLVAVGVPMVNLDRTWAAIACTDEGSVATALAVVTAQCFDEHSRTNIESWTHTSNALFCIPSGTETCEVGHRQVQIRKVSGVLGLSLGLDMLQQEDTFAIPHRNVKWLHYSSSGRSLKKLLLV